MSEPIRQWSDFTKRAIALIVLLLLALMVYRFRAILPPLMIASLIAFILSPIAGFIVKRFHVSRGVATGLVFLILLAAKLLVTVDLLKLKQLQELMRKWFLCG